ncbi:MAG: shikimate dehydrogenase [Nocardioides sp.]|uniref:shikimate dehydrogenase n=1 Tax=Nocardioides sp. TaxID=35761 RepID=UPI0039E3C636
MTDSYLLGLIGSGVTHSLTPALHMRAARRLGLDYEYRTIDLTPLGLPPEAVGDLLNSARRLGYDALNITVPCKELVLEHLDELDETAERLGAVNTVLFRDGQAVGHNTDVTGFATAMRTQLAGESLETVLMIGAGGAGRAIADALLTLGCERLMVLDIDDARSRRVTRELSRRFPRSSVDILRPGDLATALPHISGMVNCTPIGMEGHPGTPIDADLIPTSRWVADIVYRPLQTALLGEAAARGCRTLSGGHMAVNQAIDTFRLVTGLEPDAQTMLEHLAELTADECPVPYAPSKP